MIRLSRGWGVLVLGLVGVGDLVAQNPNRSVRSRSVYEDMQLFSQVLNQLRTNHPDSLDTHTLMMAAIEGMVRAADPHSYVLPALRLSPEKHKAWSDGKLVTVPISFEYIEEAPVVLGVRPGTAAAQLDILPGDELVAIDGFPVTAESEVELNIVLGGELGSQVTLTLERKQEQGAASTIHRVVSRERVEAASAVTSVMVDSVTGYIRLAHFAVEDVADDFRDARTDLERRGMTRLVLDLRDNGGGLVDEAGRIAGEFLPKNALVYTASGAKPEVFDTVTVRRSYVRRNEPLPTVVLVNEGTASAAELLAGALQDHDRALIMGRPTFGKSLLMMGMPMTDGSIIMLTVGYVVTPCGRVLQRQYRGLRYHDYLRQAGATPDTTGRPTCTTAGGRTVWGGGGIFPDVVVPRGGGGPSWLQDVQEGSLLTEWLNRLTPDALSFPNAEVFAAAGLADSLVQDFVAFATDRGVSLSEEVVGGSLLPLVLSRTIVWHRWGEVGLSTFDALWDPWVSRAIREMPQAENLPGVR